MALPFRHRIFLSLLGLGTLPLGLALATLVVVVRSGGAPSGPRAALDDVAASGRALVAALDTVDLAPDARASLDRHVETVGRSATLARRAETLTRAATRTMVVAVFAGGVLVIALSIHLTRRWSRQYSAPVDELVNWVGQVRGGRSLPPESETPGAPEFRSLRQALRDLAAALARLRAEEVERARLEAFQETARRVAHELRRPLTSVQLAIQQLSRTRALDDPATAAVDVLREEAGRLVGMAAEFAEFGRLPEGPRAPVDLTELARTVATAAAPDGAVSLRCERDLIVDGHLEPLRRALHNLLDNALRAAGSAEITGRRQAGGEDATIHLAVVDHGPGIPDHLGPRIFDPYVTGRGDGTGLGLPLVRQTITAHGGRVWVEPTPGGGATFHVELPARRP